MSRGTTARTVLSILAAVLLAIQLFVPSEAFASAHKEEVVACGEAEHPHKVTPPLRAADRTRDEDLVPEAPGRALLASDLAATLPHVPPIGFSRASRSSTAHSTATLQVFRC